MSASYVTGKQSVFLILADGKNSIVPPYLNKLFTRVYLRLEFPPEATYIHVGVCGVLQTIQLHNILVLYATLNTYIGLSYHIINTSTLPMSCHIINTLFTLHVTFIYLELLFPAIQVCGIIMLL